MRMWLCSILLMVSAAGGLPGQAADQTPRPAEQLAEKDPRYCVTNNAQFRALTGADYLAGCDFHLRGVVTLVDADRDLVVLQDPSGVVALHFPLRDTGLSFGQQVVLTGANCCPYSAQFPDFPYHPNLREIRNSFEAPTGCGDYYLTRMRGYLHPAATGEYSFWIASDNSSELWLSTDGNPSKARKIAFIQRFGYVSPHEWSHYPSQHSEPIWLQAGKTYYIEALQEQTTVGDNLAVAWQGPGLEQSVIDGRFLTPPGNQSTNGILREFWTNYLAGDLSEIGGPRPFRSILSVENAGVRILGQGTLPRPDPIVPSQPWRAENNFHWVAAEGVVKFIGARKNTIWLELEDDRTQFQVCVLRSDPAFLQRMRNTSVHVEGVCEGVYDTGDNLGPEYLAPGTIWASDASNIHVLESAKTNGDAGAVEHAERALVIRTNLAMQGFYLTHGVVTFNDRVLDKDYLFVQEEDSAILVSGGETSSFQKQLKVGELVDLGGALQPGKYLPQLAPLVITKLGWRSMPMPVKQPLAVSGSANQAGKWTELAGVVHSVNSNGTLSVVTKDGPVYFWIGQMPTNELGSYLDATLRVRGVLLPGTLTAPLLLIPAQNYVDVEEAAPEKPFEVATRPISWLSPGSMESGWAAHRVKIAGEITYQDAHSFFLQDTSGGIRVLTSGHPDLKTGDTVEGLGFPVMSGSARALTEAMARPAHFVKHVAPKNLDLSEALPARQNATLVAVSAVLLARKTNSDNQVLELEEQQRVFAATLAAGNGILPEVSPGSRVQVVGVCDNETPISLQIGEQPVSAQYLASLDILMRSPGDLTIISGPPWWTWKRTTTLVGTLLAVIAVTLLWVHLLRRRLERQHAAQLAFSRQVLERLEDERRRIAVNLHDSLGQILLAIKNQALLAIQRPQAEQGMRQRLDEISDTTSQAIEEIRQITHGLRPYQLDRLGLTQAIRASISRAAANGSISFAVRVEDIDGLFNKDAEIHVYRIVQEAVTNIVKHSAATEAAVVIKKRSATVLLSIRDNGRGFDASRQLPHSHSLGYGLSGIAERVTILGGTFAIDSQPDQGTSLIVEVPLIE